MTTDIFERVLQDIDSHLAVGKLGRLTEQVAPSRVVDRYRQAHAAGAGRLLLHVGALLERAYGLSAKRGLRQQDLHELLIAILYHDFAKVYEGDDALPSILKKILSTPDGHSHAARRLFFYIGEPRIAHHMRHNSTDFVIDIARQAVTVPQLALNLLDKTDDGGQEITVAEKYKRIVAKIGAHPDYDDESEKIACRYLGRVEGESKNFYDYEFIATGTDTPELSVLFVQRFDGKYCAPVGAYKDTNSNLKIAKHIAGWGYRTTIIHEGEFRHETDEGQTHILGCDKDSIEQLLPLFAMKQDVVIVEGSTSRVRQMRSIIGSQVGLVLLLRTLADGSFSKRRLENAAMADEIWVMTKDMERIALSEAAAHGIDLPPLRILQSGYNPDVFGPPQNDALRQPGKIVYVGAVTPIKGVDVLGQAFARLRSEMPEVELHIVGDTSIYGRVNDFDPSELKAMPGVVYHGVQNEYQIAEHLRTAHVATLLTRIYETFGKSAMQARLCHTPMLVSDQGALPLHVASPEEGIVLREVSVDTVYEALKTMLSQSPYSVAPPEGRYFPWRATGIDFVHHVSLLLRRVLQNSLAASQAMNPHQATI